MKKSPPELYDLLQDHAGCFCVEKKGLTGLMLL